MPYGTIRLRSFTWLPAMLVFAAALSSGEVGAHEPGFGIGPHTMYRGGVGVELGFEFEGRALAYVNELAYGITEDLTVTAALPFRDVTVGGTSRQGLGDAMLRIKWRFLRSDLRGATNQVALVAGARLPTARTGGSIPLGSGTTDFLLALAYGHEGRRWYWWGDVRYLLINSREGIDRGDTVFLDAAFGVRPWLLTYKQPDLVLLAEVNGRRTGPSVRNGVELPERGGSIVTAGPSLLFSYRNYMFKAGFAHPVWHSPSGSQPDPGVRGFIAFEAHF